MKHAQSDDEKDKVQEKERMKEEDRRGGASENASVSLAEGLVGSHEKV